MVLLKAPLITNPLYDAGHLDENLNTVVKRGKIWRKRYNSSVFFSHGRTKKNTFFGKALNGLPLLLSLHSTDACVSFRFCCTGGGRKVRKVSITL